MKHSPSEQNIRIAERDWCVFMETVDTRDKNSQIELKNSRQTVNVMIWFTLRATPVWNVNLFSP